MRTVATLLAIIGICLVTRASNEYRVNPDLEVIAGLGGAKKLEMSGDAAELYVCRFLLSKRRELVTVRVYTTVPRDPLTRGTIINNDGPPFYAFGFRPAVVSAQIERRFVQDGVVVVEKHELSPVAAVAFDELLVRSGFFELDPVGPWLLKNDESGELLAGELVIDGRTTVVRRYAGGSLPASACIDAIDKAVVRKAE